MPLLSLRLLHLGKVLRDLSYGTVDVSVVVAVVRATTRCTVQSWKRTPRQLVKAGGRRGRGQYGERKLEYVTDRVYCPVLQSRVNATRHAGVDGRAEPSQAGGSGSARLARRWLGRRRAEAAPLGLRREANQAIVCIILLPILRTASVVYEDSYTWLVFQLLLFRRPYLEPARHPFRMHTGAAPRSVRNGAGLFRRYTTLPSQSTD